MMKETKTYAYPVSNAQHRLWLLSKFGKANAAYNITGLLKIDGKISIETFKECIYKIIDRHETLRTSFREIDGEVKQLIVEDYEWSIDHRVIASSKELSALVEQKATQAFDLEKGPLLDITIVEEGVEKYTIIISLHHIISDGWSISVFIKECSEYYNGLIYNNEAQLEELTTQYVDYTLWEKEQEQEEAYLQKIEFWKKELESAPELLELPYKKERLTLQTFDGDIFKHGIDAEFTNRIKKLCKENNVSPFMLLLAVFKVVLNKYSGQNDILIGTPVSNRGAAELENLIGFFVNTVVIRTHINESQTFKQYLKKVRDTSLAAIENKDVSFEIVLDLIKPKRNTSYSPIFQVMFSMENMPTEEFLFGSVPVSIEKPELVYSKFDLTLSVREKGGELEFEYEFNTNLFDKDMMNKFNQRFLNVLKSILREPSMKIADIVLMGDQEECLVLDSWNKTEFDYPKESRFIDEFLKIASSTPNSISFQFRKVSLTYQQLDEVSNQIAHCLQQKGVEKGKLVALYLNRDEHLLPALLAVLKIGATYLPLDPSYPLERIKYILNDSDVGVVVANSANKDLFKNIQAIRVLAIDELPITRQPVTFSVAKGIPSSAPMYIIYTSGSTGNPKGVRIAHFSVLNFLLSMKDKLSLSSGDKLLAVTSLAFDISVLELFLPLISGGSVVLASEVEVKSAFGLAKVIEDCDITVIQGTPSFWELLKEIDWKPTNEIKILCGGEALPGKIGKWFLSLSEDVWNMYGPTETTIWSSIARVKDPENITVGKPIYNTSMYILDRNMQPLPAGLKGYLYIGGDGIAIDYYKQPELMADKFIDWVYKNRRVRLFKTGDLAKFNPDGSIKLFGREDNQVKINGYRIELGEVENKILKVKEIEKAVTKVRHDDNGNQQIVAYLEVNKEISLDTVRKELQQYLPSYMVPARFVVLQDFPLTPNGKIDRKSLPDILDSQHFSAEAFIQPQTNKERILASIWSEVLAIDEIGIRHNFFNLGGASLQSVKISSLAEKSGLLVTPEMVFEFPTIQDLAIHAQEISSVNTGSVRINQEEILIPIDHIQTRESTGNGIEQECNILIESMGMYLPEKVVLSKEIVENCTNEIRFPIERLTGIKSVRVVEDEFSIGLAIKAVERCLAISKYKPEHIDLVITCNVFRMASDKSISIEPSLSIQLTDIFGFKNALNFDITNACTGVFTAIYLAESYIKSNRARRCLIVSGEYISHITKTSQLEVESYMDKRIAGLTVGDAGFAMILEKSEKPSLGFHKLDLFTMGAYSDLCVVKPTDKMHGGFVVSTDAIKMREAGHVVAANHALKTLGKKKWSLNDINYIVMHQASSTTTQNAMKEMNRAYNKEVTNKQNIIDNIKERGNTASTTHWVATMDNILNGKIRKNDNVIYCVSGSGLTLGTALYTFDDLPERIQNNYDLKSSLKKIETLPFESEMNDSPKTVKISSVGLSSKGEDLTSGMDFLYSATKECLNKASALKSNNDLDIVVYFGIHRDDYIYEPAISTFLAGEFKINASVDDVGGENSTLAFDLMNGSMGFLNTCHTIIQLVQNNRCKKALITSSEINNNKKRLQKDELFFIEGGAALVLEETTELKSGFGSFVFENFTNHIADKKCWAAWDEGTLKATSLENRDMQQQYVSLIITVLGKLLKKESISLKDVDLILAPQLSPEFLNDLKQDPVFSDWSGGWCDLPQQKGNSSLTTPYQFKLAYDNKLVTKGDVSVIINIAAGVQIGCAVYYF